MHASAILDHLCELTREAAERWVAVALAEAAALRAYDDQLFASTNDPAEIETARRLHDAWRQWVADAEALLTRLRPLTARQHVAGAHDLDYAVGRAQAMLTISPEAMLRREEQARRGECVSSEELRRELHLPRRR